MSLPPLIGLAEQTETEWKRKARDAVNTLIRRTLGADTTAKRPLGPVVGQQFYDTTLGKPIWWHSSGVWKDAAGTTV